MAKDKKKWDDEENEVASDYVSFSQEGDYVYGALLAPIRQVPNKLSKEPNAKQCLYEMKVHDASFHKLDKKKKLIPEAVEPEEGTTITLYGRSSFDHKLAHLKVGQLFGVKFVEEKEATVPGNNPTKVFKVFLPKDASGEFQFDESVREVSADGELDSM